MAKEIIFYNSAKTEKVFPVTESNSVYTTSTGKTVRQELDEIDSEIVDVRNEVQSVESDVILTKESITTLTGRIKVLEDKEDKPVDLEDYYTKEEVESYVDGVIEGEREVIDNTLEEIRGDLRAVEDEATYRLDKSDESIFNLEEKVDKLDSRVEALEENGGSGGGGSDIDLEDYYTKDEVDSKIPTVQTGSTGTEKNYIYSGTDYKSVVSDINYTNVLYRPDLAVVYTKVSHWGEEEVFDPYSGGTVIPGEDKYLELNTATISTAGLMSATDKEKLDSLEENGGSSGGANIVELTRSEYESLTEYQPDTFYVITNEDTDILSRLASIEARLNAAGL